MGRLTASRGGRVGLPSHPGTQTIDVVGEIGSVSADEGKNGGPERVHPVQSEEIDSGTSCDTALLDWRAIGADDRQPHPVEAIAVTARPDNGANVFLAQVQRADTIDMERRQE